MLIQGLSVGLVGVVLFGCSAQVRAPQIKEKTLLKQRTSFSPVTYTCKKTLAEITPQKNEFTVAGSFVKGIYNQAYFTVVRNQDEVALHQQSLKWSDWWASTNFDAPFVMMASDAEEIRCDHLVSKSEVNIESSLAYSCLFSWKDQEGIEQHHQELKITQENASEIKVPVHIQLNAEALTFEFTRLADLSAQNLNSETQKITNLDRVLKAHSEKSIIPHEMESLKVTFPAGAKEVSLQNNKINFGIQCSLIP